MSEDTQTAPVKPGVDHQAEAEALVYGDRQGAYGKPKPAYDAMAQAWSGVIAHKLTAPLTAEEVVLLLQTMKVVRHARKPKRDNLVDAHGYLLVLARVEADL